ncbi:MAG: polyprenyl synthetase family protein [Actinomycetota bacterium]
MTAAARPLPMSAASAEMEKVVDRVNGALYAFLAARRQEVEWREPQAVLLIDEMIRLVRAGGKRLRPAFCYWGYRAAGGVDGEPIAKAGAALELLHTMALIHDDLIDGTSERRGVETTMPSLSRAAAERGLGSGDPDSFGESAALLVGDLAAVLADRLLLESGFPAAALARALAPYHEMRTDMAIGQYLDIAVVPVDPAAARRIAALKGGSYSVEGPLLVGAALAGATTLVQTRLRRFGAPLGEAFQLRDDLLDGDGRHAATTNDVNALVSTAVAALDPQVLDPTAVESLRSMAGLIAMR